MIKPKFGTILTLIYLSINICFSQEIGNEWQDPEINEINRMQSRASYFAYSGRSQALENCKEESELFCSLNGKWKFHWAQDMANSPSGFYEKSFNDNLWDEIPVPGLWELNGYGVPVYVNWGWAWKGKYKSNPPIVSDINNSVGSYRRSFVVPENWNDKNVVLHVGAAKSNLHVWVNGKFVGYSEDSRIAAEFDVTPFLGPGENLIAFQVFRWCDGSYLEDQDMWRLSGIFRDVYLYARNKTHLDDIFIIPDLDNKYKNGKLNIDISYTGKGKAQLKCELIDNATGRIIEEQDLNPEKKGVFRTEMAIDSPEKWSAENPYLYSLIFTLSGSGGEIYEVIKQSVAFRKIEQVNGQVLLNGKAILFKGVNRHEFDPATGFSVSKERMLQDIRLLKELNINAVRTSHYPDDPYWYELCDKYGIYLVSEANVESHGMGYGAWRESTQLSKDPSYKKAILERNMRMVETFKNHPSVIIWSMGNETGDGPAFEECYHWIKNRDQSRLVQFEQNYSLDHTDINCEMYATLEGMKEYARGDNPKAMIPCELTHAMGNSMGGFKDYWDEIRAQTRLQGSFIWDFIDQGLRKFTDDGRMIYAYGGDFGIGEPSDNNFVCNGLVSPDRVLNPHAWEVKKIYQSIWTIGSDLAKGEIEIYNENFFINLNNYILDWTVISDGVAILHGSVGDLNVEPGMKDKLILGYDLGDISDCNSELLLNLEYKLKRLKGLLPASYIVARDQLTIKEYQFNPYKQVQGEKMNIENTDKEIIISSESARIVFDKGSGWISAIEYEDDQIMENGFNLKPNFWRAPTDNDFGSNQPELLKNWRDPQYIMTAINSSFNGNNAFIKVEYSCPEIHIDLVMKYEINSYGEIYVSEIIKADDSAGDIETLMRVGMQMILPGSYDRLEYYGRGPVENYADRKSYTSLGLYKQTVEEQFYPYIRPQENGTKSDIRWWKQLDIDGRGIMISSDKPFSSSALHYLPSDLEDYPDKSQRHSGELRARDITTLSFDLHQMGLAGQDSWGGLPYEQYRVPLRDYTFNFSIKPVKAY